MSLQTVQSDPAMTATGALTRCVGSNNAIQPVTNWVVDGNNTLTGDLSGFELATLLVRMNGTDGYGITGAALGSGSTGVSGYTNQSNGVGLRASSSHASGVPFQIENSSVKRASFFYFGSTNENFTVPSTGGTLACVSDFSAPPPIGTTPNTGGFTSLAAHTPNGFTGNSFQVKHNNILTFQVTYAGDCSIPYGGLEVAGSTTIGTNSRFSVSGRAAWSSAADGVWAASNNAGTDYANVVVKSLSANAPVFFPQYVLASLPSASTYINGTMIVSNATGGPALCYSDGTNWRRFTNNAIVS